jgi:hypothetical protein
MTEAMTGAHSGAGTKNVPFRENFLVFQRGFQYGFYMRCKPMKEYRCVARDKGFIEPGIHLSDFSES